MVAILDVSQSQKIYKSFKETCNPVRMSPKVIAKVYSFLFFLVRFWRQIDMLKLMNE